MERLFQGHLHPLLEHPRLACPGRESNPARPPRWEAGTLAKSYPDSLWIAIRNICTWARNMAPPVHEHTWTALGCRPICTCKSFNTEYWHQALACPHVQCQARQITSGSPLWSTLPRSSLFSTRVPKADTSWSGMEPRPRKWEASTLAKSYSNSLLIAPPSECVTRTHIVCTRM
jgi:hypothetical protein